MEVEFVALMVVLSILILTMGFGKCDQDTPQIKMYRICMEHSNDLDKCKELTK